MNEMIGRVDMIEMKPADRALESARPRFLIHSLQPASAGPHRPPRALIAQDHGLQEALDHKLIDLAKDAIENGTPADFKMPIRNVHRTVGAMLSGEIARRHGSKGLAERHDSYSLDRICRTEFRRVPCQGRNADA